MSQFDSGHQGQPADPQRIAHEQAEVTAVLSQARVGRFDEATTGVADESAERPTSTPHASAAPQPPAPGSEPARPAPARHAPPRAQSRQWPAPYQPHPQATPPGGRPPGRHGEWPPAQPPHGGRATSRRRPGWAALTGTVAATALVASAGTAAFTGAFDDHVAPPAAVEQSQGPQTIPVNATAQQPDWQAVAASVRESVVAIEVRTQAGAGAGSGVVLDTEGHVLTNSHVVDGGQNGEVAVSLSDGRLYEARIVGQDETTDLAVLELLDPPEDLVAATFGSSGELAVGEPVAAVGNPLGLDSTVTTGIISALDRPVVTQSGPRSDAVVTNAIQVDAAVNPGNSGGPLFNAQGEVIGINSSIASLSGGSAAGSIGLGFAIPSSQAADVAEQLVADGTVAHAFLGVGLGDTTVTVDGVTRKGAEIGQVEDGSPAAEAGLQSGDVITAINGHSVESAASLTGFVRQHSAGEDAVLTVVRDGTEAEVTATLAVREQVLS